MGPCNICTGNGSFLIDVLEILPYCEFNPKEHT